VERLSGRMVHIQEDPLLKTLATVTTARGASPGHFVRYQPGNPAVDYLVAHQLGFLIRLFSCPEEARFEVVDSESEKLAALAGLGLNETTRDIAQFLTSSIIIQLRSYSVGMRIDRWIHSKYPGLRASQVLSIKQQLRQNEAALNPDLRRQFPKALVDANTAMNAAFAWFWSMELKDPRLIIPFSVIGADKMGRLLLDVIEKVPDDPRHDCELIKGWADHLGLTGYFHFEPHTLT
jgi:hypothetical protein